MRNPVGQRQQGRDASQLARRRRGAVGARGGRACVAAGAPGITVHPRADARHITGRRARSRPACATRRAASNSTSKAIRVRTCSSSCTRCGRRSARWCRCGPGKITSQAGWPADTPRAATGRVVRDLRAAGIRVSLFVDPEEAPIRWAAEVGADRVELYTEPFARAFERGRAPRGRRSRLRASRGARARARPGRQRRATISIWPTSCCSVSCRIWTRCRSAMR